MGFTIVPHMWVPEKIAHDCTALPAVPPLRAVRGDAAAARRRARSARSSRRRSSTAARTVGAAPAARRAAAARPSTRRSPARRGARVSDIGRVQIDGGVTAPRGFRAAGVACGIKASRRPRPRADRVGRARQRRRRLHDQPGAGGAGPRLARAPRAVRRPRPRRSSSTAAARTRAPARTACEHARGDGGARPPRPSAATPSEVLVASTGVIGVKLDIDEGRRAASPTPRRAARRRRRRRRGARDHDDRSVPEGGGGRGVDAAAARSASAAWPRAPA